MLCSSSGTGTWLLDVVARCTFLSFKMLQETKANLVMSGPTRLLKREVNLHLVRIRLGNGIGQQLNSLLVVHGGE